MQCLTCWVVTRWRRRQNGGRAVVPVVKLVKLVG